MKYQTPPPPPIGWCCEVLGCTRPADRHIGGRDYCDDDDHGGRLWRQCCEDAARRMTA